MPDGKKMIIKNEKRRVKELRSYKLLDTKPEESFDRLTRLAAAICNVPISLVSLLDADRQWFKSKVGINESESARNISFCHHAIKGNDLFEVQDALEDERFKENPFVTNKPHARYYLGAPLITSRGYVLGTLCVIDKVPRELTAIQKKGLRDLADEVMDNIEARHTKSQLLEVHANLLRSNAEVLMYFENTQELLCVISSEGLFLKLSNAWSSFFGKQIQELEMKSIFDFMHPTDVSFSRKEFATILEGKDSDGHINRFLFHDGTYHELKWQSRLRNGVVYAAARDVTVDQKNQRELKRDSILMSEAQRMARLGAWELDPQSNTTVWTDEVYDIYEVSKSFVHDKLITLKFFHPNDRSIVSQAIEDAIVNLKPWDKVCRFITAKENHKWVRTSGYAIVEDGRLEKILGVIQDITEIEEAKLNIQREENFSSSLIKNLGDGFVLVDKDMVQVDVNSALLEMTGFERTELIGKKAPFPYWPTEETKYIQKKIETFVRKGSGEFEVDFIKKTGERIPVIFYVSTLPEKEDEKFYYFATIKNISIRKELEKKIIYEKNLFSNGPVMMIEWDPSDGWGVRYISENVVLILGFLVDEVISDEFHYSDRIHPNDFKSIKDRVHEYSLHSIGSHELEYRFKVRTGEYRWLREYTRLEYDKKGALISIRGYVIDNTELKNNQMQIEHSKRRLAEIISGTNVGTWEWNVPTGEAIFNERWANIIGHSLDEILPGTIDTWFSGLHQNDIEQCNKQLQKHFNRDTPHFEIESRMKHKDGYYVWVLDRGKVAQWNKNGEPLWMYGTRQDITDRKIAEVELITQKEEAESARNQLSSVIEALPDALFVLNEQKVVSEYYSGNLELIMAPIENFIGQSILKIFSDEIGKQVSENIDKAIRTGKLVEFNFDAKSVTKKSREYYNARMLFTKNQQVICILRNVTQDTIKSLELDSTREFLAETNRVAKVGGWSYNLLTKEVRLSDTTRNIFGMSDLESGNIRAILKQAQGLQRKNLLKKVRSIIKDGEPFEEELKIETFAGSKLWINMRLNLDRKDPRTVRVYGTIQDIDARKKMQLELEKARHFADEANRAKSDFLTSMSHELRTPLNAVIGFSQLLELNTDGNLDDDEMEHVLYIQKAGQHLLQLINDILDLSKIESRKVTINIEAMDANETINEISEIIKPMAQKNRIITTVQLENYGHPNLIFADRVRFKQVLMNLVSNAVKYNKTDGYIKIISKRDNHKLRISVQDTGRGIEPEKLKMLFQPFQRLGAENSNIEGTGIGLLITKRLVESMNGSIGYESRVGEGSTFWVEFPLAQESDIANSARQVLVSPKRKPTTRKKKTTKQLILYVEDNPDNLVLMERFFKRIPEMKLVTADNGKDGLKYALTGNPDLVLLDLHLPGLNGFEVLEELRKNHQTESLPVFAISAAANSGDIEKGLQAGFTDYIGKPFIFTDLVNKIRETLKTRDFVE